MFKDMNQIKIQQYNKIAQPYEEHEKNNCGNHQKNDKDTKKDQQNYQSKLLTLKEV